MRILLTGGCGFIGSHIADFLIQHPQVEELRIMDNLATGFMSNLGHHLHSPKLKFFEKDIRNADDCMELVEGVDAICHQAALGSVPRSIADPLTTHEVNLSGFLHILNAAREHGVKKMVYASSSSVYGSLQTDVKYETQLGAPLSPYAVTKQGNEMYAEAFARSYGMQITGFRYFNVFGPRQNPHGPYAAVVPLFISAALAQLPATIFGDGSITRDFTYVANVVKANTNALFAPLAAIPQHTVYNVACGATTSLLRLWDLIGAAAGYTAAPKFGPPRKGDILYSLASIEKAAKELDYNNLVSVEEGIALSVAWYKAQLSAPNTLS